MLSGQGSYLQSLGKRYFFHSHSNPRVFKSNALTIELRLSPNSGRIKDLYV